MKNGFTIIELMITIMILALVVTLGVPGFSVTIKNNRLASQYNTLISTLNFARSESVKRNDKNVTICASTDQASCSNSSDWSTGWIVFVDADNNKAVSAGETLLRVEYGLEGGNTLSTVGFSSNTSLTFDSIGMITRTGTFVLCDDRGAEEALAVAVNKSGQSRPAGDEDSPADSIVNDHDGDNVTCP